MQQHIGIGQAIAIENIEIKWPVTGKAQVFKNPPIDINIKIKESDNGFTTYKLVLLDLTSAKSGVISCTPK